MHPTLLGSGLKSHHSSGSSANIVAIPCHTWLSHWTADDSLACWKSEMCFSSLKEVGHVLYRVIQF